MSGTIWLIAEGKTDYEIVKAIIQKRQPSVLVKPLNPSGGGIAHLANQLDQLIRTAQEKQSGNDCIVVLHDRDQHEPDRTHYDNIRAISARYPVTLIVATDAIEAWLLSDSGVWRWLKQTSRVKNWNSDHRPKSHLDSLMKAKKRLEYNLRGLDRLLEHLKGDGINQSLQQALQQLDKAPCVKS